MNKLNVVLQKEELSPLQIEYNATQVCVSKMKSLFYCNK